MSVCNSSRLSTSNRRNSLVMEPDSDLDPSFHHHHHHHHHHGSSSSSGAGTSISRTLTPLTSTDESTTQYHRSLKHPDRSLNLNLPMSVDDYEPHPKRQKTSRDPQSHRIIEKRRRDRMNNCLGDLSKLIPSSYLKQGQGRIEKTEIIELAIVHIKRLQAMINCLEGDSRDNHDKIICHENFLMGFKECAAELMRFLVEVEGYNAADSACVKLRNYLEAQSQKFAKRSIDMKLEGQCDRSLWAAEAETNKSAPSAELLESRCEEQQTNSDNNKQIIDADRYIVRDLSASFDASNEIRGGCESATSGLSSAKHEENYQINTEKNSKEIYKFKNDIKLRFTSRRKEPARQSDSSSSSCSRDGSRPYRPTHCLKRPLSPSSESTAYPVSELSGNSADSGTNPDLNVSVSKAHDQNNKNSEGSDVLVPAFALHPSGTHYVPIAVHVSKLGQCGGGQSSVSMYHPISIPVNFSGSFIGVRNLNIQSSVKIENANSTSPPPPATLKSNDDSPTSIQSAAVDTP
ncbi:uncharacterized protein LOC141901905 [Tubulanus polymorphus]|uniref:uncharacterized protein LOC141901905 n=1 Tax=Tubulanus polymorphus TaxID=672921 RepID=UPI003DA4F383